MNKSSKVKFILSRLGIIGLCLNIQFPFFLSIASPALIFIHQERVLANDTEIDLDKLLKTILDPNTKDPELKQAREQLNNLSDADLKKLGQKLVDLSKKSAKDFAKVVDLVNSLPVKHPLKSLIKKIGNLGIGVLNAYVNAVTNICNGNWIGKRILAGKLQEIFGPENLNSIEALALAEKIIRLVEREKKKKKEKEKKANLGSSDSLQFDQDTLTISFSDNFITGIENREGIVNLSDSMVGAEVITPTFTFVGLNEEGFHIFLNQSELPIIVQGSQGIFLEASISSLILKDNQFTSFINIDILSGASPNSLLDGGLDDLESDFIQLINPTFGIDITTQSSRYPDFSYEFMINPTLDIISETDNFTKTASSPFVGMIKVRQSVPEPSSSVTLLGLGILGTTLTLKRKLRGKTKCLQNST